MDLVQLNLSNTGLTGLGIGVLILIGIFAFRGYRRGFVKEAVSLMFVVLAVAIVWNINPYVQDFLKENTPVYDKVHEQCAGYVTEQLASGDGADKEGQSALIEALPLPESLRNAMEENNNTQVYQYLAVETFADYIADYLAIMITNGIAFLLSYLLAVFVIHMVTHLLDLMARLPVLNGVNRLAGIAVGVLRGLIVVWILLLVLTIFCNTPLGREGMSLVREDPVLSFLYNKNLFVHIFLSIFYGK